MYNFLRPVFIYVFFALLLPVAVSAQSSQVDSLLDEAKNIFRKDHNRALSLELEALELSRKENYIPGLGRANYYLGYYFEHAEKVDYGKTIVYYLETIRESRKAPKDQETQEWAVRACINIGSLFNDHEVFGLAIEYYKKGLEIAYANQDASRIKRLLLNLENSYEDSEQYDLALETSQQLLSISDPYSKGYFRALNNFGTTATKKGDFGVAIEKFTRLKNESFEAANYHFYVQALNNLGWTYRLAKNVEESRRFFELTIRESERYHPVHSTSSYRSHSQLAELLFEMEEYSEALGYALRTEEMLSSIKGEPRSFETYRTISNIYSALGKEKESNDYSLLFYRAQEEYYKKLEKIKSASQQFNFELIVSSYHQELKSQRQAGQTETVYLSIIIVLAVMLFLGIIHYFYRRFKLNRFLSEEIEKLEWID